MKDITRSIAVLMLSMTVMNTAAAQQLSSVPPPAFDTAQALGLMAIQLSCLDRLQPKVPLRALPRDTTRADSTRTDTSRAPAGDGRGGNYLWVTTCSLVPANNQTRAF